MVKPIARPYSQYSLHGLELLGSLVHEARIHKALTTTDLAARAGISRSLLQRIERGDPNCSIGAVFEVASICGVPLFNEEQRELNASLLHQREKLTLLPKSVRSHLKEVNDNF